MKSNFNLKKKVVNTLSREEQASINGGGTTSFRRCSRGFICCGKKTKGSFAYCEDNPV